MRQVPHYLLIGNGRVAKHFQHYFTLLNLSFATWHRAESEILLAEKITQASHILLLISDQAIDAFHQQYLQDSSAMCLHFSGALQSDRVFGAHPLMTFNTTLYQLQDYQAFPFIVDQDAPPFADLLPGLPNQFVYLDKQHKSKYHAVCVMAANYSCLLWQKLFATFADEFHIPNEMAHAFLKQQTANLIADPKTALTGPLSRSDMTTIQRNLAALNADPFQAVYQSFVDCYPKIKARV